MIREGYIGVESPGVVGIPHTSRKQEFDQRQIDVVETVDDLLGPPREECPEERQSLRERS